MKVPKRATNTAWISDLTVYPSGRVLIETDTGVHRIADGVRPYYQLPIFFVGPDILDPDATTIAYAASITPNADTTTIANVGTLTGNITINAPTGTPSDGQVLRFRFAQDATGSRTVTWNAAFAFGTDVTAAMEPSAASSVWERAFMWHAGTSKWRAMSIVRF
jgi:hypothetical protein